MARKLKSDRMLFFTTTALAFAGLVMVYSASNMLKPLDDTQSSLFLMKQILFTVFGVAAMAFTMRIDYHVYRNPKVIWAFIIIAVVTLLAVLAFGPKINGARRWFRVAGIGIQPSEFAKIAVIILVAAVLEQRMDRIKSGLKDLWYVLKPIAIALAVVLPLIYKEPDMGTTVVIIAVVSVMVFAAGLPIKYMVSMAAVGIPALAAIALKDAYRMSRFLIFLNPEQDPQDKGFQILQSLIAVGTGGLTGRGLGESVQKMQYLPYPHSDFIFAVTAEELGLVGASIMLLGFAVVTWRGLRVAYRAPDAFGSFLALGLTTMIGLQAFVNMSVVLGLLPTKGIALPLISAGGSSLIVSLAGMGVLLNISEQASAEV